MFPSNIYHRQTGTIVTYVEVHGMIMMELLMRHGVTIKGTHVTRLPGKKMRNDRIKVPIITISTPDKTTSK